MAFDPKSVLIRSLLTEKSDRLTKSVNQYLFEVSRGAAKGDIRRAVEALFKVKVEKIRTVSVKGKPKRQGRWEGRSSDWKKAVITVAKGQELNLNKI